MFFQTGLILAKRIIGFSFRFIKNIFGPMRKALAAFSLLLCSLLAYSQKGNTSILAYQFFQNGQYEKAAALYEDLFSKDPGNRIYYENYITSLIQIKELDKAEKVIKKQSKRFPKNLSVKVDLGKIYLQKGDTEKASQIFQGAVNALSTDLYQITELAQAFMQINQTDLALETYLKGRKLMRDKTLFTLEISRIYHQKQDKMSLIEELLVSVEENETMMPQVQNSLQDYLTEPRDFELLKSTLLKRIQRAPDKTVFAELMIWQFIQQKQFELALIQTIALDKRLKEEGLRVIGFAKLAASNEAYDAAIKAYQHIIDKGPSSNFYLVARHDLLDVRQKKVVHSNYSYSDLQSLENDYKFFMEEFGKTPNTAFAMQALANLQALYLNKTAEAIALLEEVIEMKGIGNAFLAQCKLDLGDIYVMTGETWEATLLFGQVDKAFKDEPLGQQAKFRNARLSYYNGDFEWAKAQLDVLKASTSQLIANDALNLSLLIADNTGLDTSTEALRLFARADLLVQQNRFEQAGLTLDSINLLFPGHSLADEILWVKSKMLIRKNDYAGALLPLQAIIEQFPADIWADDALFQSAEIHERRLNDIPKAMELYQQVLTKYPGSLYNVEARKRYRTLRGDAIN